MMSLLMVLSGAETALGQAPPGVSPGSGAQPGPDRPSFPSNARGNARIRPASRPATSTAPADPNAPKFRCDEIVRDFGEAFSGDVVEHTYVIRNEGKSPLELLSVKPICGCTVVPNYDKVIAPGGEGKLTAKLTTPKTFQVMTLPKTITVETNDPANRSVVLTLKGKVKPRISIDPANAAFGNVTDETDVTRVIKVTNNTDERMKLELIPLPPAQKTVFKLEITEVEPGKVANVKVTGVRPFAERMNTTTFRLSTGMEKEKEISIGCSLNNPPLVEVSPSLLLLYTPVTREFIRHVTITYNGKGDFVVKEATCPNQAIKLDLTPLPSPPRPAVGPGRANEPNKPEQTPTSPKSYRLTVQAPKDFNPPNEEQIDITLKTNLKEKPELKVGIKPNPMPPPPVRPQTPNVTRLEELLGRPCPVTSIAPLKGGQNLQVGTSNQVAVVNFWTSWSSHSRRQLATLKNLNALYSRRGVMFVNVSLDSLRPAQDVLEAAKEIGMPENTLCADPRYTTAARFGIRNVPTLLLVGKNGTVEAIHEGMPAVEQTAVYEQMLKTELDALLDGKSRSEFAQGPKPGGAVDVLESQGSAAPTPVGSPPPGSTPKLTIESVRQDLGGVKPGAKVAAKVYLRNDGMRPLDILSVTASPGLTLAAESPKSLRPQAMAVINGEFVAGAQPGTFEHKVSLASNDPTRPKLDITFTGRIRPYLECDPITGIDFGRDPRKHTMGRLATILYNGSEEIKFTSAECSSPKFETTIRELKGGQSAMLVVNPKGPFDLGELNAVVKVTTTCKEQPTIEVPVKLFTPKRIEVTPEAVLVSPANRSNRYSIAIANNSLESLNVLGVSPSNKLIRTQFYPDADGFSYRMEVLLPANYAPPAEGDRITIRTDDKELGEIVIPIKPAPPAGGELLAR